MVVLFSTAVAVLMLSKTSDAENVVSDQEVVGMEDGPLGEDSDGTYEAL